MVQAVMNVLARQDLIEAARVNAITFTGYMLAQWHGFLSVLSGVSNEVFQEYLTTIILFFIVVYNVVKVFDLIRHTIWKKQDREDKGG